MTLFFLQNFSLTSFWIITTIIQSGCDISHLKKKLTLPLSLNKLLQRTVYTSLPSYVSFTSHSFSFTALLNPLMSTWPITCKCRILQTLCPQFSIFPTWNFVFCWLRGHALEDMPLSWFSLFTTDPSLSISFAGLSLTTLKNIGVLRGSVLGSLFYSILLPQRRSH